MARKVLMTTILVISLILLILIPFVFQTLADRTLAFMAYGATMISVVLRVYFALFGSKPDGR